VAPLRMLRHAPRSRLSSTHWMLSGSWRLPNRTSLWRGSAG
jgi:hypothetical protein